MAEGGVCIFGDAVEALPSELSGISTNTTSVNKGNKRTSSTIFVFEDWSISGKSLAFPQSVGERVRKGIVSQVSHLDFDIAQMVVHEVSARLLINSIKGDAVSYSRGIAAKALYGKFFPAAGLALADELDAFLAADANTKNGLLRIVK